MNREISKAVKEKFPDKAHPRLDTDGPPAPGVIGRREVPAHLRSVGKNLRIRGIIFDYEALTIQEEVMNNAIPSMYSGWDPRHARNMAANGPYHGVIPFIEKATPEAIETALKSRGLKAHIDGEGPDEARARLQSAITEANSKWVTGLLANEIRHNLKEMGIDPFGKVPQLSARLQDALHMGMGVPPPSIERDASRNNKDENGLDVFGGVPESLIDVRAKYRTKLLKKTGGLLESTKVDRDSAEALSIARQHLVRTDMDKNSSAEVSPKRWLLGTGAGEVLEYLDSRSIQTFLLPRPDTIPEDVKSLLQQMPRHVGVHCTLKPADVAEQIGDERRERIVTDQKDQDHSDSSGPKWLQNLFLISSEGTTGKQRTGTSRNKKAAMVKGWIRCISIVLAEQGLKPNEVMVISNQNEFLEAGRESRCLTIALSPPNSRRVDVSTDVLIESMVDVRRVIDDYNGISYRS
eukprot:CAMPEP_0185759766 /NCGR_PEP_ID=MMETSP1174-20130828/18553_1 /TAXON_ID=35687 /ORGANISM="Dictyocha speculum, Strain CCMP1381" /LENGTH=463 /DNA_ID=CAMNT_0028440265 /DNA_START=113 /DNA_END=1504 /DNA_ORIENTATION=+